MDKNNIMVDELINEVDFDEIDYLRAQVQFLKDELNCQACIIQTMQGDIDWCKQFINMKEKYE